MVCGREVMIVLVELVPLGGLMSTGLEYHGEGNNWRLIETIDDMIGASYIIFDVEMELLQVCGPLLIVVILQFSLCLYELQRLMISVNECLIPKNVMLPLATCLYNGINFFVICGVLVDDIC
jgi:hypothetical protein